MHFPVLRDQALDGLRIRAGGIYVDGTVGGGGHAQGILERLENGTLVANDLDPTALARSKERLARDLGRIEFVHDDYKNLRRNLEARGISKIDGLLLDLGISSYQIDTPERGFSYMRDGPLDMRMNPGQTLTAYDVANCYSLSDLTRILRRYGEEKHARRIAEAIGRARRAGKISSTLELAKIISDAYPAKDRARRGHPAKRAFQAIRIEVNGELDGLGEFVRDIADMLNPGGRICAISFHSLEDRAMKRAFADLSADFIYDRRMPSGGYATERKLRIITKKPVLGSTEIDANERSRSAKLRIAERV